MLAKEVSTINIAGETGGKSQQKGAKAYCPARGPSSAPTREQLAKETWGKAETMSSIEVDLGLQDRN
jgi:hypothetical protein